MKKTKIITALLTAALAAASFAGCGADAEKTVDGSAPPMQGQNENQAAFQGERGIMAKVVSLNGDQLTVILADMPKGDKGGAQPEKGTPPGDPGRGGRNIEFTGEEVTYTLSGNVVITKGTGDSAAEIDLSELAPGDVIQFMTITGDTGEEKIAAITVME